MRTKPYGEMTIQEAKHFIGPGYEMLVMGLARRVFDYVEEQKPDSVTVPPVSDAQRDALIRGLFFSVTAVLVPQLGVVQDALEHNGEESRMWKPTKTIHGVEQ